MISSIFYKEWIKTRWIILLCLTLSIGFVLYALLRIARVVELKDAAYVWEIILTKEFVFIDALKYIPLFIGVLVAIAQYVPEIQQKRLKLTLHLPVSQKRIIAATTAYGVLCLLGIFIVNYLGLWAYLQHILAPELTSRILLTSAPWYIAGIAGYAFASWICVEPTWKYRIVHSFFAAGFIQLLFLNDYPEAYNNVLWLLIALSVIFIGFIWISVTRFKTGKDRKSVV